MNLSETCIELFNGVFKGKRILITGHTGFKGSWLTVWLTSLGSSVIGYSLDPPTHPSLFDSLNLVEKINHIQGDVRDFEHLQDVIGRYQPEIIFHLAAQALVRRSYADPRLTYETNIMGTVNLLDAVRHNKSVRVVINVTSDKCYENREWVYAYRENDTMGGFDPYSSSKGCAELVTSAYNNSFFKSAGNTYISSARAGNVIGGGDWAEDRIIPDCIRALTNRESIIVRNPNAIRPWQHVLEPLSGYLCLASSMWIDGDRFAGAWNFGPDATSNIPVYRVVDSVTQEWGYGGWHTPDGAMPQPHEAKFLKLDCTKANNHLGWYPVYNFEQAIRATTAWYKVYYERQDNPYNHTLRDINNYVDEAREKGLSWSTMCNRGI